MPYSQLGDCNYFTYLSLMEIVRKRYNVCAVLTEKTEDHEQVRIALLRSMAS
jgi:hypothetical protein